LGALAVAPTGQPHMTLQLLSRLGDTFDVSTLPRGTSYSQVILRVGAVVNDPNYVFRDNAALGSVWAINLLPWQMPGTAADHTQNRNHTFLTLATSRARIQIGNEGATENYLVDYPASGTTIVVAGQQLTVALEGQSPPGPDPTIQPPVIGCYVSPAVGAPGPMTATLTTIPSPVGASGSFAEGVPPRARYFRLLYDLGGTANWNVTQQEGNGNPLGLLDRATTSVEFQTPSARRAWYPLHPDCQVITVSNADASGHTVAVQWLLTTCG
jgi:hypothetical protein